MQKELLTIPEFLVAFSISRTSFYREVNAGRLRLRKRGVRSFVAQQDAQAWLESLPRVEGPRHV